MATASSQSIIEWEKVAEVANLEEVIPFLPPERVIQILGVERAIETIGLDRVIEVSGPEKLFGELLARIPEERIQEMLRQRQG